MQSGNWATESMMQIDSGRQSPHSGQVVKSGRRDHAAPCHAMITGPQITAARTLLGWSIPDLARRTGINIADIQEAESGAKLPNRRLDDLALIQTILEEAGIEFIESVGVQFRPLELNSIMIGDRGSDSERT
jgi:DNA-binding transcriptional regulator YiaG